MLHYGLNYAPATICALLGREPWEGEDVLDVDGHKSPPDIARAGAERLADWKRAATIRRELKAT
jgi:hypothetical protein